MWIKGGIAGDKVPRIKKLKLKNQNEKYKKSKQFQVNILSLYTLFLIHYSNFMKYQSIYNRIKRIEGQVRGIGEMLASDKPEQDILIQIEAARSSLGSAISSFIEQQLSIESDGKIELNKEQLRAILRSVKK